MSFELPSFNRQEPNSSDTFDYYRNNAKRLTTQRKYLRKRKLGRAQSTTTPSTTSGRSRYSVEFRTVDARDLEEGRGASLVDVHCTGSAIRDFHNVKTGDAFDEQTAIRLFGQPPLPMPCWYSRPRKLNARRSPYDLRLLPDRPPPSYFGVRQVRRGCVSRTDPGRSFDWPG